MSSKRLSDENSNPDTTNDVQENADARPEVKYKPLIQSNETSEKKKLSTFEKKQKARLEKSGMKKGSLLKYFVKGNPEEMQQPVSTLRRSSRRSTSSSCNINNGISVESTNNNDTASNTKGNPGDSVIRQNSGIECVGAIKTAKKGSKNYEVIEIPSDSDSESVGQIDSPRVSACDDDDDDSSSYQQNSEDITSVINVDNSQLSSEDKIEQWQRQNKRILQDEESVPHGNASSELQPPPPKASKLDVKPEPEVRSPVEITPDSQSSQTSTPPLKIINVFTLSETNGKDAKPSTSRLTTATTNYGAKSRKTGLIYNEIDNSDLSPLIEKKSWRKVIEIVRKDLLDYKLPSKVIVSQLIRKAILCENTRVSKDVPLEGMKLLEEITKSYPPQNGTGRDVSVKYYKGIFEKVFYDGNGSKSGNGSSLSFFLSELMKRVDTEKNALSILILVTQLCVEQYEVYERVSGVKVNPPLFQYFLEEDEGVFTYNKHCESIVERCFNASTDEEFCIYLKWVDLIAKRLGDFPGRKKDYERMILSFASQCCEQSDNGLLVLMNLTYKPFSTAVCTEIFNKFKIICDDGKEDDISETERISYLHELSKTLLIKPAADIACDLVQEVCKTNSTLTFYNTRVDSDNQNMEQDCDSQVKGRRKNVKGESRLHILCRPGQDNPVPDVRKHLRKHPEDVNARDNFGNTPLHDCARNNKGNIIVAMMELYEKELLGDVDFLARNKSMETPMHLAATYCNPQTIQIMIYFASTCRVLDQVLTSANREGKLPFELVPTESQIKKRLIPTGYNKASMLVHGGLKLDKDSQEILEESFELRKLLAWWSQNCH